MTNQSDPTTNQSDPVPFVYCDVCGNDWLIDQFTQKTGWWVNLGEWSAEEWGDAEEVFTDVEPVKGSAWICPDGCLAKELGGVMDGAE